MQRVTEQGLKKWSDLEEVSSKYQSRKLIISYRQTERLFSIAKDLYRHVLGQEPEFSSAFPRCAQDLPAVLHKSTEVKPAEQWLSERICEIHALCTQHLPTTAILVAHPDAHRLRVGHSIKDRDKDCGKSENLKRTVKVRRVGRRRGVCGPSEICARG